MSVDMKKQLVTIEGIVATVALVNHLRKKIGYVEIIKVDKM